MSEQFELLWFTVKCGPCRCEGFGWFRDSVYGFVELGGVAAAARLLLKGQQNLVCFNCRRGDLTANFWLTCGARLVLLSWRSPSGAVGNLFLMSPCDVSLPGLIELRYWCDRQRTPLWDRYRLGNNLQWVSGFLSRYSWIFPEQPRSKSELAGLRENRDDEIKHPKWVARSS